MLPLEKVTLWLMASLFVNVTTAPLVTWMFAGENAVFCKVTLVVTTGAVGVEGMIGVVFVVPVLVDPPHALTSAARARRAV
jgi:hypothetical protein